MNTPKKVPRNARTTARTKAPGQRGVRLLLPLASVAALAAAQVQAQESSAPAAPVPPPQARA